MPRKRSPNERPEHETNRQASSAKSMNEASEESAWVKGKRKKGGSRNGSSASNGALIEKLLEEKDWKAARASLHEELVFKPSDHWLWLTLSSTYYEDKDYDKALVCGKRAVELEPGCPLALWHYAGALYMTQREPAAFAIWTVLLNTNIEEIAHGEHGEGMAWAL